ncbi:MAG: glycoside hydrolase family 127 protein, partial [Abditibacteriota bacterium]|nr:glycoside hydrolase family 127 protein [Abditibacteriota bacterium]
KTGDGFAALKGNIREGSLINLRFPMKIKISRVDDSYTARRYPLCVERGPIVYAIDVPAAWNTYPGLKITPETDTWPWYEARPDFANLGEWSPWAYALDEKTKASDIKVVEKPAEGYVWENPPVVLEVPMYRTDAAGGRGCWQFRNYEEWSFHLAEETPRMVTMVPHGCTNLRVTYVPNLANREK